MGDTTADLEESRTDQTIFLDSWLRAQPVSWLVRPYAEGILGLKLLDTKYSLSFPNGSGETSTVTDQATASTYGLGFGVEVRLAEASDHSGSAVFASVGVRELWGSRATFTRAPDASAVNQTITFDVPTRSTLVLLGIALRVQHLAQ